MIEDVEYSISDQVSKQAQYQNVKFLSQSFFNPKQKQVYNKPFTQQTIVQQSQYRYQYIQYFKQVQEQADTQIFQAINDINRKIDHKIIIHTQQSVYADAMISFKTPKIFIKNYLYNASIVKYDIIIGNYKIYLDLLNTSETPPNNLTNIGSGAFGVIYRMNYNQKNIIIKRINFLKPILLENQFGQQWKIFANKDQIQQMICEYSIYKISSFYKIGPAIFHDIGFDLICSPDSIEFYMEECLHITGWYLIFQYELKLCLRKLHKLKLIHKDIKPENILFSIEYNRIIYSDYGISHSIQQEVGYKTKTYKQGTYSYMGRQMQELDQKGYVDLYYNDKQGLQKSIKMLKQSLKQYLQEKPEIKKRKNEKVNRFYERIYFLNHLLNKQQKEIIQFIQERPYFLDELVRNYNFTHIKNKKLTEVIKHFRNKNIDNSKLQQKLTTFFKKLNQSTLDQHQLMQYLLRIYGFSQQFADQMRQLSQNQFVRKTINNVLKNIKKVQVSVKFIPKVKRTKILLQRKLKYFEQLYQIELRDDSKNIDLLLYTNILNLLYYILHQNLCGFELSCEEILFYARKYQLYYEACKNQFKIPNNLALRYEIGFMISNYKLTKNIIHTKNQLRDLVSRYPDKHMKIQIQFVNILNDSNMDKIAIQSLQQFKIQITSKKDSQRIHQFARLLISLGILYQKLRKNQKVFYYFNKVFQLCQSNKQIWYLLPSCQFRLGKAYQNILQHKQALIHFKNGLKYQIECYGEVNIMIYYQSIGFCYQKLKQFQVSLQYLLKANQLYQTEFGSNSIQAIQSNYGIGTTYLGLNNQKCLTYCEKAIYISKQLQNYKMLPRIYLTIAKYYNQNNNLKEFQKYLNLIKKMEHSDLQFQAQYCIQWMNYYRKLKNPKLITQCMNKFFKLLKNTPHAILSQFGVCIVRYAQYLEQQQDIHKAIECYLEALKYFQLNKSFCFEAKFRVGNLYFGLKSYSQALIYFQQCFEQIKPQINIKLLLSIGCCWEAKKNLQKAKYYYQMYRKHNINVDNNTQLHIYKFMSKYYQINKNYAQSIQEMKQYLNLVIKSKSGSQQKFLLKLAQLNYKRMYYHEAIYFYKRVLVDHSNQIKLFSIYNYLSMAYLKANTHKHRNKSELYKIKYYQLMKTKSILRELKTFYEISKKKLNCKVINLIITYKQKIEKIYERIQQESNHQIQKIKQLKRCKYLLRKLNSCTGIKQNNNNLILKKYINKL